MRFVASLRLIYLYHCMARNQPCKILIIITQNNAWYQIRLQNYNVTEVRMKHSSYTVIYTYDIGLQRLVPCSLINTIQRWLWKVKVGLQHMHCTCTTACFCFTFCAVGTITHVKEENTYKCETCMYSDHVNNHPLKPLNTLGYGRLLMLRWSYICICVSKFIYDISLVSTC